MGVFRRNFCRCKVAWGNINNAVMARLGENPVIPPFMMYSEVLQESVVHLLETGKISGASASSLTISADSLRKIYDNMDYFASRIVLRPQEISNNPEIIRRLGVIALNVGRSLIFTGMPTQHT